MTREKVTGVLQIVEIAQQSIEEVRRIVDEEALQVGDRNILDHSIATITSELEIVRRTFGDMLEDPTKSQ